MRRNLLREFWHTPRTMNLASGLLVLAGLTGLLMSLGLWLANQPFFSLRQVVVDAPAARLVQVQQADIREALGSQFSGTALTADLRPLQAGLSQHPWIRQVSIRRVWPNRWLVRLEEHEAVAIWTDGRLVNRYGELFVGEPSAAREHARTSLNCQMPRLGGPVGTLDRVIARARAVQSLLQDQSLRVTSVSLTEQFSWQLELDGRHRIVLGREGLATDWQSRLTALVQSLPWLTQRVLRDQPGQALHLDLRYANGYAFSPMAAAEEASPSDPTSAQPSCLIYLKEATGYAT